VGMLNLKKLSNIFIITMFIALFSFSSYLHYYVGYGIIKKETHSSNIAVSEIFINDIYRENSAAVEVINNLHMSRWRGSKDFLKFTIEIIKFFKDFPVVKASLYNGAGQKFFSTNRSDIIDIDIAREKGDVEGYGDMSFSDLIDKLDDIYLLANHHKIFHEKIANGIPVSEVITPAVYREYNGGVRKGSVVHTLIPINAFDGDKKNTVGFIEIYNDISEEWNHIAKIRYIAITIAIIISVIFYIMLYFNASEAQLLIDKQADENKKLIEARERAENENMEKSQFLANVSHELRTPLNAIIGFSDVIRTESMGPLKNEKYAEYVNDINVSGKHLLSLINDILDYSKASAEKLTVESIPVDIRKIIAGSVRLIVPRAEEAGVELRQEFPQESCVIMGDAKRLKQSLLNLLSNSVKFTPSGGIVTTQARVEIVKGKKVVSIKIIDNGIGMAEKDISLALSSFGQVDSRLSRKYEGTGLGLPFTKKLVELMNGVFHIKSELGIGTTVTMSFPYVENFGEEQG
jgi:two-component system, cell cycle sensor histidine kinase PleC